MTRLERIIASTTAGPIEGRARDGALLFAGVPYAAPPVGERRFKAPVPHEPWTEVRAALRFGPAAPQYPTGGLTSSAPVRYDEDCLTLNVTTPALDEGLRPVLVWIHGGGYRTGQGAVPWYDGGRFARNKDIVVVSINYRLGLLGFTDLSRFGADYATSGANGTMDQIAALRWVQDNIAGFGGDPGRVTIAGESAGAFSVSTLLASPLARGLFRAAIAQSGAAQHTLPAAAGALVADAVLATLGIESAGQLPLIDLEQILDAQRQVIDKFAEGSTNLETFGVAVPAFYPVEGNSAIPVSPLAAMRQGAGIEVPVLTGTNQNETTLWGYGSMDDARLERIAERHGARSALEVYRSNHSTASPDELVNRLMTDQMFRIPAIRMLEAREAASNGRARHWMYWFCWQSRAFRGRLGATHALEIPFAFDNLDRPGVDTFLGPGERPQGLATQMHDVWARFIHELDPGFERYDTANRMTLRFDNESQTIGDPDSSEREAWAGLR